MVEVVDASRIGFGVVSVEADADALVKAPATSWGSRAVCARLDVFTFAGVGEVIWAGIDCSLHALGLFFTPSTGGVCIAGGAGGASSAGDLVASGTRVPWVADADASGTGTVGPTGGNTRSHTCRVCGGRDCTVSTVVEGESGALDTVVCGKLEKDGRAGDLDDEGEAWIEVGIRVWPWYHVGGFAYVCKVVGHNYPVEGGKEASKHGKPVKVGLEVHVVKVDKDRVCARDVDDCFAVDGGRVAVIEGCVWVSDYTLRR